MQWRCCAQTRKGRRAAGRGWTLDLALYVIPFRTFAPWRRYAFESTNSHLTDDQGRLQSHSDNSSVSMGGLDPPLQISQGHATFLLCALGAHSGCVANLRYLLVEGLQVREAEGEDVI